MLTLNVLRGRKFAPGVSSIRVSATFARESKTTSFAQGNGRDGFAWGCVLQWKIDADALRKASAQGVGNCKVAVEGEEKEIHGWIVIDMRSARMNAIRADYEGDWMPLSGPKVHPLHETPELFLRCTYQDEHQPLVDKATKHPPLLPRLNSPNKKGSTASPTQGGAHFADGVNRPPFTDIQPQQIQQVAGGFDTPRDVDQPWGNANSTEATSILPGGEGPRRMFKMTVDFRSFNAGSKLPLALANVFVEASLPKELAALVGRMASGLRSYPPVDCARGDEVILAGGYSVMQFNTGIVNLATVLAKEPRIVIDVWHREPMKNDTLLGVASVPLAPLLQKTFIDSLSPVYAMIVKPPKPSQKQSSLEKQVQIGSIRVAMSIEDLGHPVGIQSNPSTVAMHEGTSFEKPPENGGLGSTVMVEPSDKSPAPKVEGSGIGGVILEGGAEPLLPTSAGDGTAAGCRTLLDADDAVIPTASHLADIGATNRNGFCHNIPGKDCAANPGCFGPEYNAALELELWKKSEEEKFLDALEQREKERMAVLELEWRKHEKLREEEVGALRGECSSLELRLKEMLESVEARERKLVAAEESQSKRKKDLEREYTARISEAEAAVRRLQVECEHQLTIERDRNTELSRLKRSAEERLAAAESRCIALERNFAEFRLSQQHVPEAKLQWEIQTLQEKLQKAEQKSEKLLKSKSKYKMEVIRLAQEIAEQHRVSQGGGIKECSPHVLLQNPDRIRVKTDALQAVAEENVAQSQVQREQLNSLRNALESLKLASTCASPPPPPPPPQKQAPPHKQPKHPPLHTDNPTQHLPHETTNALARAASSEETLHSTPERAEGRYFSNKSNETNGGGDGGCPPGSDAGHGREPPSSRADTLKVERLLKEKFELLKLGVYGEDDEVIKSLDERINVVVRSGGKRNE